MVSNTMDLLSRGMRCLVKELGIVEAEQFISVVKGDTFGYEKWQREFFDSMTPEEMSEEISEYIAAHPYKGNATVI